MILPERVFGSVGREENLLRASRWRRSSSATCPLRSLLRRASRAGLRRRRAASRTRRSRCRSARPGRPTTAASATSVVADERALDLHRADAVARDVHHVVDATHDPEVARPCRGGRRRRGSRARPSVLHLRPVGLLKRWLVAPDAAQHAGPGLPHGEEAAVRPARPRCSLVEDRSAWTPGKAHRRRAGLRVDRARERRDQDPAGLGLPPRVDDRATLLLPMTSWYHIHASGLIGSPTEPSSRSDGEVVPLFGPLLAHLMNVRIAVGAV